MWIYAGVALIVAAGAAAGITRSKALRRSCALPLDALTGASMMTEDVVSLSSSQIDFMLARLEREEAPEPVFGAMCYEMMAAPSVAEYICPICGEKTVYMDEYTQTAFISWELDGARRLAESIDAMTDLDIVLDETLYCSSCCAEEVEDPYLVLRVIHENGDTFENRVSLTDLRKLDSFLRGRLYWLTDNDSQEPLKDDADRIRELLGFEEE